MACTNEAPRKYQEIAWEKLQNNVQEKKATVIRLPCGYGKTLIGLVPFLAQAIEEEWNIAPRLIYVLPMRALTNEVRDVALKIVQRLNLEDRFKVKALHGEAWDTPHLFSDIAVTTLDSFLYAYARKASIESPYSDRHVDFAAGSIANSMVVFDEAHMYQGGNQQVLGLFRLVTKYLVKSGIPVLVMTATMPKVIFNFLFNEVPYEDITFKDDEILYNKSYKIVLEPLDLIDIGVRNFISTLTYKKLLIVANTVCRATRVYEELKGQDPILLHARIRSIDKEKRLTHVKDRLKEGQVILISTQVCEAGLDFDFDTLVTDLAPADSMVQRIGRVARRGGEGMVIIHKPRSIAPYDEMESVVDDTWKWLNCHKLEVDFSKFSSGGGTLGVQDFVDESWNRYNKKLERFKLTVSEVYFMGKGLISEPDLDFDVRGTRYVILVAPYDGGKSLLDGGVMKKKEFDECKFSVDFEMVKKHAEWIKHQHNKGFAYMNLRYENKNGGYTAHPTDKLKPYEAYLVSNLYYSYEVGLKMGDKYGE